MDFEEYKKKTCSAVTLLPNSILMEGSSLSEDNILDDLSDLELEDTNAVSKNSRTRQPRSMSTSIFVGMNTLVDSGLRKHPGNYENKYQKWKHKCKHQRKELREFREKINSMQDEQEDETTRIEDQTDQQEEMMRLRLESVTHQRNELKQENQRLKEENEELSDQLKTKEEEDNTISPLMQNKKKKPKLLIQSKSNPSPDFMDSQQHMHHQSASQPAFHEYYSMPPYGYWYPGYPGYPMPMHMTPQNQHPLPMHGGGHHPKRKMHSMDGFLVYNNNSNDEGCINMEPNPNNNLNKNDKNKKNKKKKKKKIPKRLRDANGDDQKEEENSKWPLLKAMFPSFGCACSGD